MAQLWLAIALMLNPIARGMDLFSGDATGSFTNLAGRLLESELSLRQDAIQIYPANQYTPGVHRILQLAANIYDATTNRFPLINGTEVLQAPSVFRPIFRRNPGPVATNVFIAGYREVESSAMPDFLLIVLAQPGSVYGVVDLQVATNRTRILPEGTPFQDERDELMVAGIPVVVAARKGFPNFNKFEVQNSVTVARRLRFERLAGNPMPLFNTNQSYTLTITNSFGAQAWNSYSNQFTRPVRMFVVGEIYLTLTNELGEIQGPDGSALTKAVRFIRSREITNWPGFDIQANTGFLAPLVTNVEFLPPSFFQSDQNQFILVPHPDAANYFPVPRWVLSMNIQFRYVLLDQASGRILDAVNLSSSEEPVDVMKTMAANAPCVDYLAQNGTLQPGSLWCTNRFPTSWGADNPFLVTYGILNQLEVSMIPLPQFRQL
jgi:hypothetical protein